MGKVFDHRFAFLCAVTAHFCACCHMLVIGNFFAGGSTYVASLGACFAGRTSERTLSRGKPGCDRTQFSTIDAQVHCFRMLLLAFRDQAGAMVEACVAHLLAIRTDFGTFGEVLSMLMFARPGWCTCCHRKRAGNQSQKAEEDRRIHVSTPVANK